MRRILLSTSCFAFTCFAAAAFADMPAFADMIVAPDPDVAGSKQPQIENIVVSATRSPVQLDRIGSSITILDETAIKASQVVIVSDLLAQTPGVDMSRNGGVGGTTSLRIRGAETDQTVVVVDGVKVNDPSSPGGGFNFADMMIGDIQRIEILRGAQSTLWGSQAIGGVVNIVTVVPTKPFEVSADAEGGSYGTAYSRVGVGGKDGRFTWRAAGGYYTTDGISAASSGTEPDGYHNASVNGRLRTEIADNISLDLRGVYYHGHVGLDGFPPPTFAVFADDKEYSTTKEFTGYAGLNFDVWDGRLKNRVAFDYTDNHRNNYDPTQTPQKTFESQGKNKRWEYQGTFSITEGWNAVFGAETEKSTIFAADQFSTPLHAGVNIASGYAQVNGEVVKGLTLTGGVRHDSHDTFGHRTLGQAAAAWSLNDGNTIIRASWGQGFKAPTLYQLYSDFGNTTLKPEEANSWDGGVEQHFFDGKLVVSAIGFLRNSKNLITFVNCPDPLCKPFSFGVYKNTAQARAKGVELTGTVNLDKLTVQANYTLTDTENRSPGDPNFGKELARRPRNTANLTATYLWPMDISTGVTVTYVGRTFDDAGNTFVLPRYALVDLKASVPVTANVEIYGRIENLFDQAHVTTRNYGSLGRGAYAGVRARF